VERDRFQLQQSHGRDTLPQTNPDATPNSAGGRLGQPTLACKKNAVLRALDGVL
jgi:hypothetical protein